MGQGVFSIHHKQYAVYLCKHNDIPGIELHIVSFLFIVETSYTNSANIFPNERTECKAALAIPLMHVSVNPNQELCKACLSIAPNIHLRDDNLQRFQWFLSQGDTNQQ